MKRKKPNNFGLAQKCPKCGSQIKGDTFYKESLLSSKVERISQYYCPKCDFEREHRFNIDWIDYYSMISEKKDDYKEEPHDVKFGGILIKPLKKNSK